MRTKPTNLVNLLVLILLVALIVMLRLPGLEEPFDEDSGANAYHARLIVRGETLYSTHHPSHHLPAVYYTYAAAFIALGDRTESVKILLILWVILTAYLIYHIGKKFKSFHVGILAAIFYSLLTSHVLLEGTSAKSELFANLPIAAAISLAIHLLFNQSASWKFLFVGILGAFAMLYKVVFVTPLLIGLILIFFDMWHHRKNQNVLTILLSRVSWLALGWSIIMGLVIAYFTWSDLLPRFLMVFTLGSEYVNELITRPHWIAIFVLPLYILAINNIFLLLLSMAGSLNLSKVIFRLTKKDYNIKILAVSILAWFIISVIVAGYTRKGWPYYSQIIIPPLALLAAWELNRLVGRIVRKFNFQYKHRYKIIVVMFLLPILVVSGLTNAQFYYRYARYKLGMDTYREFLLSDINDGEIFLRMNDLAIFICENTTPEDNIYSWSLDMQIYYMSDRRAPIDMIWPSYVDAIGSYSSIFNPKTKYIIYNESQFPKMPSWLQSELEQSYQLVAKSGPQYTYERIDQ